MKKAELKAGVAYFVSTSARYGWSGRDSVYEIHNQNKASRYYVLMQGDEPMTAWRNPSQIYMTRCKTYGADCPTHRPKEGGASIACPRDDFRLMDIRDEYWAVIKRLHKRRQEENKPRDIRAQRLARIAKRDAEAQAKPIEDEFYSVLSQICNERMTSWDKLGGFSLAQKQAITKAIKAGMAVEIRVAS
jgi:hypothetical protein